MGKECFDNIPRKIGDLLTDVENGRIGLPDLQRPFVWKDNKVRELMDSMLKGYPIGFVMLWATPEDYSNKIKQIGSGDKPFTASCLFFNIVSQYCQSFGRNRKGRP